MTAIAITGLGVTAAIGDGLARFADALRSGRSAVSTMPLGPDDQVACALLPEAWTDCVPALPLPSGLAEATERSVRLLRHAPPSARIGCRVSIEAMAMAGLPGDIDPEGIAVLVAGNNLAQGYVADQHRRFLDRPGFVNPRYVVQALDTFLVGALGDIFGIRGYGGTVGGGFASGNLALLQAMELLRSGAATACLCVGPMADLGPLELHGFANIGALSPFAGGGAPGSRPFDRSGNGFAYGQAGAAIVLERREDARRRDAGIVAEIAGVAVALHGSAGTEPDAAAEARVMRAAIARAGLTPAEIGYVNAHATGTPLGDAAEAAAILDTFGASGGPAVNATKALTGHPLFAAGLVELVATAIQVDGGFLHGNPALSDPVRAGIDFVGVDARPQAIRHALSNSFGFGGINSAAVVSAGS